MLKTGAILRKVIKIPNMANNVSIALCTYNGMPYLRELLKSIAGQSLAPAELVVCDDCSGDATPECLDQFSREAGFPVRIYRNSRRLGVIQNFAQAIALCDGNYVALCDQDDIWLPDKLAVSLKAMQEAEAAGSEDEPVLAHTDLQVADLLGKAVAPSFMRMQKINHVTKEPLKTLLVQNFVTGCTVLINRPLIKAALPLPENSLMHDWWLALIAASLGRLVFIPQPTALYRQHGRNAVGAKKYYSAANLMRLARLEPLDLVIAQTIEQACSLKTRLEQSAGADVPAYLSAYLDAALAEGKQAASIAAYNGIGKQGWFRNRVFLWAMSKSGYLKHLEGRRC
jgi:glycosyltransferase involved in cell wall biosynthesis